MRRKQTRRKEKRRLQKIIMKKRTLKERKEDFKKAYYAGLKEQGLIDTVEDVVIPEPEVITLVNEGIEFTVDPIEETNDDLSTNVEQTVEKTKKELIAEAEELGLKVDNRMTKAQIIELIKEAQNG